MKEALRNLPLSVSGLGVIFGSTGELEYLRSVPGSLLDCSMLLGMDASALVSLSSLVTQSVRSLPAMWETQVHSLGQEDPLEEEMATHPSIPAWRSPWTGEPDGLQSMRSQIRTGLSDRHSLLVSLSVGWKIWANLSPDPCGRSRVRSRFSPENKGYILRLEETPCNLQLIFHPKILPAVLLKLTLGRERFWYLVLHPNDPAFMSRYGY